MQVLKQLTMNWPNNYPRYPRLAMLFGSDVDKKQSDSSTPGLFFGLLSLLSIIFNKLRIKQTAILHTLNYYNVGPLFSSRIDNVDNVDNSCKQQTKTNI